jgi:hypothetical protein
MLCSQNRFAGIDAQLSEFTNKITSELYLKLDIKETYTAPTHPQCNILEEVLNKNS